MFITLKERLKANFEQLSKSQQYLYYKDIDRDKIWDLYLDGFVPEERQGHNCNCCKSFLRQYSGIVAITDELEVKSIWDFDLTDLEEYQLPITNIKNYINSLPITNRVVNPFPKLGTDKNFDPVKNVIWNHFFLQIPNKFIHRNDYSKTLDGALGEYRDNKTTLKRALDEISVDAIKTVLELINDNNLYRGKEFLNIITDFCNEKTNYLNTPIENRDVYAWKVSSNATQGFCRFRNTAIGTLLVDLSEGMDLDQAVRRFEAKVAPTNYKRSNSIVTPKMVEQAKEKLQELGFVESLDRRYAEEKDLNINNLLFVDKSSNVQDVFGEISKEALVNPKSLEKSEEVTIEEFLNNIVPQSKSIELLLENSHLGNMVSLLTASNEAPSMFKWNNPFSWSYTGGITDSMKERVKNAGGNVEGVLRFSIQWNENGRSIVDLDAHCIEPDGNRIYFQNKRMTHRSSGMLDVDMINPESVGVENITWTDISKMSEGTYRMIIHNYNDRINDGFQAQIEFDGQIHDFSYIKNLQGYMEIAEVTYSNYKGFSIKPLLPAKSNITSKEKWGVKTNQFVKVKSIMLSPNHWENHTGNKHYLFMLENCVSDESPRPFFNEFLKEDLLKERKVFEVLASKLQVQQSRNQLSGIGFSETQRNHVIARVEGKTKRNYKIKF